MMADVRMKRGIVKRVRRIHQEIYPREITFMPVAILRDFDDTSPGAAYSKSNRFVKFSFLKSMH